MYRCGVQLSANNKKVFRHQYTRGTRLKRLTKVSTSWVAWLHTSTLVLWPCSVFAIWCIHRVGIIKISIKKTKGLVKKMMLSFDFYTILFEINENIHKVSSFIIKKLKSMKFLRLARQISNRFTMFSFLNACKIFISLRAVIGNCG